MVEGENKTSGLEKQLDDIESESGSSKDSISPLSDLAVPSDQRKLRTYNKGGGDGVVDKSPRLTGAKKDRSKPKMSNDQKFVKGVPKSIRRPSTPSAKGYSGKDAEKKNATSKAPFQSSVVEEKPSGDVKEISKMDQVSCGTRSVESDEEETHAIAVAESDRNESSDSMIQEMESKIEKLEEELREVAALEISIYSVVPEHGSSAHKVHTPARRLSRLYIHACKHWNQDRRATIAKNTVSGLVLVSKSCGNDVPRLTFWLSNIVVLREIICETFGSSRYASPATKFSELNRGTKASGNSNKPVFSPLQTKWLETGTFTSALECVESWIFSRLVESVWWQTLAPNMQSSMKEQNKYNARVPGPSLGNQQQGSYSINLWQKAFEEAFQKLCPVRAGGHVCGCVPVLAKMVMEQCMARLDVAMFNAILRESVHEIPTDPISDPILDPKVLPIPAGELSFGSGAQLKNSIGNWSRWLNDLCDMDVKDFPGSPQKSSEDESWSGSTDTIAFPLLNALSDLLMLPKDMLLDRSVRKEVCPLISLSLIKRILCNFTPDEFCPDHVPGTVLEALNAESIVERRLSGDPSSSFPYKASIIVYSRPKTASVAYKVADVGARSQLMRNASLVQKKGYTSDDELQELSSPLESIMDKLHISPSVIDKQKKSDDKNGDYPAEDCSATNTRYELLSEVWHKVDNPELDIETTTES